MTCFGQQSSSAGWGSNGGAQRVEATSILYKAYSTSTVRPRSSGKAYIIDPPTLSGDQSKSFAPFFPSRLLHITSIPDEYAGRYELLLPIPVTYDEVEPGAVIASFQVAGNQHHRKQPAGCTGQPHSLDSGTVWRPATRGPRNVRSYPYQPNPGDTTTHQTAMISKREAEQLATKLESVARGGGRHMKVPVYVDGIRWTTFGYSHDTRKPNPHIARDLGITQNEAQALARCHRRRSGTSRLCVGDYVSRINNNR